MSSCAERGARARARARVRLRRRPDQMDTVADLTFFVPATAIITPPESAEPATTTPPGPAAQAPRCRRVHFPDLVGSPIWLPPAAAADDDDSAAMMAADEAEPPPPPETKEVEVEEEDRMDMLWEEFNEELLAMRRRARGGGGGSCSSESSSDAESEWAVAGRAPPAGCFPVLRPSERAGGAAHYRRRAGTWVLLMRIFGRLFVIDKTVSQPRRRHVRDKQRAVN